MPSVILKPGKERRLHDGHCWVYAGEIARITGDAADGNVVDIRDAKERFFGRGLLNRKSQITVRRFTTQKEELDATFFRRRITAALEYREERGVNEAFRVVFSEADLLPGLIVDKYGDCVVLQALTLGIEQRKREITGILNELLSPKAIVERSDVATRKLEGFRSRKACWPARPTVGRGCSYRNFPSR